MGNTCSQLASKYSPKLPGNETVGWWILRANLKKIVEAQGIPLSYVIRENDAPDQTEFYTWKEKAVLAAPLNGILYKQDNLTVNNIIIRNIADASDAF